MIPRPTLTFALSLLTVAAAAFVLHRADTRALAARHATPPAPSTLHPSIPTTSAANSPSTRPIATPGVPWSQTRAHSPGAKQPPRPRPATPRAYATLANPGESLADVATRVYGSPDFASDILAANRDQRLSLDSPLASGTILRTPRLQP